VGRREAWRFGLESEVLEYLSHDKTVGRQADQLAHAIAMRTDEHVDLEHALHQLGPSRAGRTWGLRCGSGS
jgi:hypothetical protein